MKRQITILAALLLPLLLCGKVQSDKSGAASEGKAEAFVEQLIQRDSILIADQLHYGFELPATPEGTGLELPEVKDTLNRYVLVVSPWQTDTLKRSKKAKTMDLKVSMTITSFDEGEYLLPSIPAVVHYPDGKTDTLVFEGQDVLFCTMPVDTATFKIHDIKAQMRYPVTFREVLPWIGAVLALAAIVSGIVWFVRRRRRLREEARHHDPAHIVALRKLDSYRGDKFWAPSKQKAFYSGVTDALREYICARYGVSAMEMTTAEMFAQLQGSDMPEELKTELRTLFERADFVKFAKYVASDEENAEVLPLGVRFVTTTYQEEIEGEAKTSDK